MTSQFVRLFFMSALLATLTACSTNPINNGTTVGGYTGGDRPVEPNTNKEPYTYNNNTTTPPTGQYDYTDNKTVSGGIATTTDNGYAGGGNPEQTGFVVQLIASISEQKAKGIKDTFAAEGYPAIQNSIDRNGQTLYRVQIGPYASKSEASTVLNQMRRRYQRNPYVDVAFINQNR